MSGNDERPEKTTFTFEEFLAMGHFHQPIDWDWVESLERPLKINLAPRRVGERWVWRIFREWERRAREHDLQEVPILD